MGPVLARSMRRFYAPLSPPRSFPSALAATCAMRTLRFLEGPTSCVLVQCSVIFGHLLASSFQDPRLRVVLSSQEPLRPQVQLEVLVLWLGRCICLEACENLAAVIYTASAVLEMWEYVFKYGWVRLLRTWLSRIYCTPCSVTNPGPLRESHSGHPPPNSCISHSGLATPKIDAVTCCISLFLRKSTFRFVLL